MTPDCPIPRAEHDNVVYVLWLNATSLESRVDDGTNRPASLDRMNVEAAYNVLNRIGYTTARPAWKMRAKLGAGEQPGKPALQ